MMKRSVILMLSLAFFVPDLAGTTFSQSEVIEIDKSIQLPLSAKQIENGWIALFDGHSLFGWRAESDANWRVEDGMIRVDSGQLGLLRTTSQFDDFQLRIEFQAGRSTNSGIFIRTSPKPTNPAVDCYEINIAPPENAFPTASIVARVKSKKAKTASEFQWMEITASAGRIQVSLNDQLLTDYTDDRPLGRGFIGLQFNSGPISFRNVWLRPLNAKKMFNGRSLDEWKIDDKSIAEFQVTPSGDLRVSGGPGQLESVDQYRDFVLQLKAKIAPKQNSGVFFRCIPGEKMNGYESQIDNGIQAGNRHKPSNGGTGGIFRRQVARRVVSDDQRWFAKTIAVCGPHMSVWVNGYQVVDWTDQRKPDRNPRRGRRLERGTIILQAHDADTNIRFRDIQVRELSPRGR